MVKPNQNNSESVTFTFNKGDERLPLIAYLMDSAFIMPSKLDLLGLVKFAEQTLVANCGDGQKRYSNKVGDLALGGVVRCAEYGYQRLHNDAFNRLGKDAAFAERVKVGDAMHDAIMSGIATRIVTGMPPEIRTEVLRRAEKAGVKFPKGKIGDQAANAARQKALDEYYEKNKAAIDKYLEKQAALQAESDAEAAEAASKTEVDLG